MSKERFPLDIFSVKEFGVNRWIKKDKLWPILDQESLSIAEKVANAYIDLILGTNDKRIGLLLVAQYKLVLEISGVFHALLILDRINNNDIKPLVKESTIYFDSIINDNDRINGLYEIHKGKLIPSSKRKLKDSIKHYLLKIKANGINISKSQKETIFSLSSKDNVFLNYYARIYNKTIKFAPLSDITNHFVSTSKTKVLLKNAVKQIKQILEDLCDLYKVELSSNISTYLNRLFYEALNDTNTAIDSYYSYLKNYSKREYFIPSLGHIQYRSFAIAAKLAGHSVIGSTHGNSIGMHDAQNHALIELSIVDKYLVATNAIAGNYNKLKTKYLSKINDAEIISVNSEFYRGLLLKYPSLGIETSVNNIMVLEYPLTEIRHNIYSYWPYQLNLMLRLGAFLSNQGLYTIMKRHPDRLKESENLYNDYYNKSITEPFEEVFEKADAFFFMNITSTTFGFALTTNRPIFIFSTWLEDIWEEMVPYIKRRCIVIPSWIDKKGYLQFDVEYFIKKINCPKIKDINYDIVDSFLIP